jgi:hypothetical protein
MFKHGDKVRVKAVTSVDTLRGVFVGYTGMVIDAPKNSCVANETAYVVFDEKIESYNKDNGRYLPSANLELIQSEKKKRGFQVGDKVVVVRGRYPSELESKGLLGRFGKVVEVVETFVTVRFSDWREGWDFNKICVNDCWAVDNSCVRRVVTK